MYSTETDADPVNVDPVYVRTCQRT